MGLGLHAKKRAPLAERSRKALRLECELSGYFFMALDRQKAAPPQVMPKPMIIMMIAPVVMVYLLSSLSALRAKPVRPLRAWKMNAPSTEARTTPQPYISSGVMS